MNKLAITLLFIVSVNLALAQGETSQNDFRRVASEIGASAQELEGIEWHPGVSSVRAEGPNVKGLAGRKRGVISLIVIDFPKRVRAILKRKETFNPQLTTNEEIEREARQVLLRTGLDRIGWVLRKVNSGATGGSEFAAGVVSVNFDRRENGFYTSAGFLAVGMDSKDGRVVFFNYARPQVSHEPPPAVLPNVAQCLSAAKTQFAEWAQRNNITISPEKLATIQATADPSAVHFQYMPVGNPESSSGRARSYKGSGRIPLICNVNLANYVVQMFADSLEPMTVFSFGGSSLPQLSSTKASVSTKAEVRSSSNSKTQPKQLASSATPIVATTAAFLIVLGLAMLGWARKRKH